MKRKIEILFVVGFFLFAGAGLVFAEGTAGDYAGGMGIQIARGVGNVLSSPAEIPCTIQKDMSVNSGTGFFTGFGKGLAFMVRRIVVGVCEIGTFMLPSEGTLPVVCTEKK